MPALRAFFLVEGPWPEAGEGTACLTDGASCWGFKTAERTFSFALDPGTRVSFEVGIRLGGNGSPQPTCIARIASRTTNCNLQFMVMVYHGSGMCIRVTTATHGCCSEGSRQRNGRAEDSGQRRGGTIVYIPATASDPRDLASWCWRGVVTRIVVLWEVLCLAILSLRGGVSWHLLCHRSCPLVFTHVRHISCLFLSSFPSLAPSPFSLSRFIYFLSLFSILLQRSSLMSIYKQI